MALLKIGILNKTTSIPTTASPSGIYFVNTGTIVGIYIVSSFSGSPVVTKIFNSGDWYTASVVDSIIQNEVLARQNADTNIQNQITGLSSGQLGSIPYNASAPTPGKNGWYDFLTSGIYPSWLTPTNPITNTVNVGDRVSVIYTSPSTYLYLFVPTSILITQTLTGNETGKVPSVIAVNNAINDINDKTNALRHFENGAILCPNPGFITVNGTFSSYSNWMASDYVLLDTIMLNATITGLSSYVMDGLVGICFFTAAKVKIGYYQPTTDTGTTPEVTFSVTLNAAFLAAFPNAAYFRCTTKTGVLTTLFNSNTALVSQQLDFNNALKTTSSGFITPTGSFAAGAKPQYQWEVPDFITINSLTTNLTLCGLSSYKSLGLVGLAFYTIGKAFIGYYLPSADTGSTPEVYFDVTINSTLLALYPNAYYFRYTRRFGVNNSLVPTLQSSISANTTSISVIDNSLKNAINGFTCPFQGFITINCTFSSAVPPSYLWMASDYIALDDYTNNLKITGLSSYILDGLVGIAFFTAAKVKIGYYQPATDTGTTPEVTFSVTLSAAFLAAFPNAAYFRCTTKTGILTTQTTPRELANTPSTPIFDVHTSWWLRNYVLNMYSNIVFCGDSVTKGFVVDYPIYEEETSYSYPVQLNKLVPSWTILNTSVTGISPLTYLSTIFPTVNFASYQMAFLELGYNGTFVVGDVNVAGTNANAYKLIASGILAQNPNIKLFLIISSNFVTARAQVVQSVAATYSLSIIDLTDKTYFDLTQNKYHGQYDTGGVMSMDYAHFNRIGYNAKAFFIYNKIIEILNANL